MAAFCEQLGEKRFRATQLFRWIHQRGARDFDQMTDLAKSLREKLRGAARIEAPAGHQPQHESADGTIKWLFDVGDGNAVEAVFIPEDDRGTLVHLVAGRLRGGLPLLLHRPPGLQPQPDHRRDRRRSSGSPSTSCARTCRRDERVISNVVMMGMGEPLQNYAALVPALRIMLDDHGYGLSRRRVTVSTSGVVPMIDRLGSDCPVALAVSLHAPNDALRDDLVPLNRKYPLAELLDACKRYLAARAARLHHFRILHARRRERPARARAAAGRAGARHGGTASPASST